MSKIAFLKLYCVYILKVFKSIMEAYMLDVKTGPFIKECCKTKENIFRSLLVANALKLVL